MKQSIDPSEVKAYNHYSVDGDKPVISNEKFKQAIEFLDKTLERLRELKKYALDTTQSELVNERKKEICGLS